MSASISPKSKSGLLRRADAYLLRHKALYFALILALPFAAALALYLLAPLLIAVGKRLPDCPFHQATGLFCPGCGMTRSITAALHGHWLISLRCNILPLAGAVAAALLYLEWAAHALGKRLRTFLHNGKIMAILGAAILIFLLARNCFPALCPIPANW